MSSLHRVGTIGLICMLAISVVGCIDNPKDRKIKLLERDKTVLSNQLTEIKNERDLIAQDRDTLAEELALKDTDVFNALQQAQLAEERAMQAEAQLAQFSTGGGNPGPQGSGWERVAGGSADRITVGSDILFGPGRATLTDAGKRALGGIARDLTSTYASRTIRVYGHTDSDPIKKTKNKWQDNLDLSANRAMAVTRYLIDRGVDAARIETVGMGASRPIAGNSSASGKAKNRRVELYAVQ